MKEEQKPKIEAFTDLRAWQEAHALVLLIYKMTKAFPKEEQFGLTSQMRRCAVSITSNIAEGFSRRSAKEKKQFYSTALGSTTELQSQLLVARDVDYVETVEFDEAMRGTVLAHKLINGLRKSASDYA